MGNSKKFPPTTTLGTVASLVVTIQSRTTCHMQVATLKIVTSHIGVTTPKIAKSPGIATIINRRSTETTVSTLRSRAIGRAIQGMTGTITTGITVLTSRGRDQ